MVFVLALAAALANALTSVFQRMAVESAPASSTLRLSLIAYALKRKIWLLGFALMIVSFVLQASALHVGELSQVQPILTTELVFLVVILAGWFGFAVNRREIIGSVAVSGGLAGFLIFAHPRYGTLSPPLWEWIVAGTACGGAIVAAVVAATRGAAWWRAAMFGTAAAISFAFTSALTKTVSDIAVADWTSLYRHWETYALAVFGGAAVFLAQNAFHAGPIVASQSTIVLVDPLASILIGVGLFGDNLRTTGPWGARAAISLVVRLGGAYWLAHSPLVSGLKGHPDRYHQRLSQRSRSARMPDAACPSRSSSS